MPCLFVLFAAFVPRLFTIIVWIARPEIVNQAFNTVIIPILGIIFLPFTTLIYLILYRPGVGIEGADWIWLILAVILDISHLAASAVDRNLETGWRSGSTSA
jgi:hypothetical protein